MQLIPRYLLKNRITIVANELGFTTEFVPVYTRQLKIYKGIDNNIQFRLLNADQRPIDINNYTPKFVAFDMDKRLVIEHEGSINQIDDSSASRGLFTVNITENDLLNLDRQYLSYNIYLLDSNNNKVITYVDSHFDNNGTLFVDDYAFPGPVESYAISTFIEDNGAWYSESITAEPAINGNEALHTASFYTTDYIGDIVLQVTLDNAVNLNTNWATLATTSFTGTESKPLYLNFRGVYNFIRFKTTASPNDKVTKILVRN